MTMIFELRHYAFKLDSEFSIVRLKEKLTEIQNDDHRNYLSGEQLARILFAEEWEKHDR